MGVIGIDRRARYVSEKKGRTKYTISRGFCGSCGWRGPIKKGEQSLGAAQDSQEGGRGASLDTNRWAVKGARIGHGRGERILGRYREIWTNISTGTRTTFHVRPCKINSGRGLNQCQGRQIGSWTTTTMATGAPDPKSRYAISEDRIGSPDTLSGLPFAFPSCPRRSPGRRLSRATKTDTVALENYSAQMIENSFVASGYRSIRSRDLAQSFLRSHLKLHHVAVEETQAQSARWQNPRRVRQITP
jgi:hypothetical protein